LSATPACAKEVSILFVVSDDSYFCAASSAARRPASAGVKVVVAEATVLVDTVAATAAAARGVVRGALPSLANPRVFLIFHKASTADEGLRMKKEERIIFIIPLELVGVRAIS